MNAVHEDLTFEEVAELFDQPAPREEYCRRFAALMLERLPIVRCAVAAGPRGAPRTLYAADAHGTIAHVPAPPEALLDALYQGEPLAAGGDVFLPLGGAGACAGFVALQGASNDFDADDAHRLHAYARILGLALEVVRLGAEVERLTDETTVDTLTGVLNRRGFDERMRAEWRRCVRDRSPLAVALLDVDHFKAYNDAYGRQRGDACLKHVARAIVQAGLRAGDFVARYGGEEFAVVMPGSDETGAFALCDRIRTFVALRAIEHHGAPHRVVTVSGGVVAATPDASQSMATLLYQADDYLHRAKESGRNCVAGRQGSRSAPGRSAALSNAGAAAAEPHDRFHAVLTAAMLADLAEAAALLGREGLAHLRTMPTEATIARWLEYGTRIAASDVAAPLRLKAILVAARAALTIGDFPRFTSLLATLDAGEAAGDTDPQARTLVLHYRAIQRLEDGVELAAAAELVRCALADVAPANAWIDLELRTTQASLAWRTGNEDEAALLFGRLARALRSDAMPPHVFVPAALATSRFELERDRVDAALPLLLDAARTNRRAPIAAVGAALLDRYVLAACRRDKHEIALRLHAFVESYRAGTGRLRTPSAQGSYSVMAARHALAERHAEPDLADLDRAIALALTI